MTVCMYSNSRNDVPQVAQPYGTIAAHTRRRASCVCSVLRAHVQFCQFDKADAGRYKVRKEPSPAKRCEKSGKDAKRAVLWKKKEALLYRTRF